jgi:hypothetical protein
MMVGLAKGLAAVAAVFVMAAAFAADAAPAGGTAAPMAGVYKTRFENGLVDGEKYASENILEIVPYRGDAAFFRIHLEFYNGHECNISGIAEASGDRLVFRGPTDGDNGPCLLSLRRAGDGIHLYEAENGACRNETCGARGGYGFKPNGAADFVLASRRPIRYLSRLLASDEYVQAVKEFGARPR